MTKHKLIPIVLAVSSLLATLALVSGCGGSGTSQAAAGTDPFGGLQQKFTEVVNSVSPKVVQIQSGLGLGSGVVFDGHGNVVTNAHVVQGSRRFVVTLSGGARHPATLVGSDPSHDLAVVHVSGPMPPAARLGESPEPRVGDIVLAVGNPLGLRSSVTQGIVSSIRKSVPEGNGVALSPAIQTSAAKRRRRRKFFTRPAREAA